MRYIVGFSRKLHLVGRAIMFFTRSNISHVYLRQEGDEGVDYVLDSAYPAVRLQWHEVWKRNKPIVVHEFAVEWNEAELTRAWAETCYQRLNLRYGVITLLGDAMVYLVFWLTKRWIWNPFHAPHKDVCSELVLGWLLRTGIPGFDGLNPNTIAPSDAYSGQDGILEAIRRNPDVFREL